MSCTAGLGAGEEREGGREGKVREREKEEERNKEKRKGNITVQ